MAKFNFHVFQDVTRETFLEIEASSVEEARKIVNSIEPNNPNLKWSISNFSELFIEDVK